MSKTKPTFPLTYERTENDIRKTAIYSKIFFKDVDGDIWFYKASKFLFDLDVICDSKVYKDKGRNLIYPLCSKSEGVRCSDLCRDKACPDEV